MQTIITFDVGTTAMKCCAFDENYRLIASATSEYKLNTVGEHIIEADPELYFSGMCSSVKGLFEQGIAPASVAAVGITTQGETMIPLDAEGRPVCPAMVWLDTRAGQESDFLMREVGEQRFYRTTGLSAASGAAPIAKLKWLAERSGLKNKIHKIVLLEDYLIYRLTGVFASEPALLCSTMYFDIVNKRYDRELLKLTGIDESLLPEVLPTGTVAGKVSAAASALTGFPAGTPVVLTAMDQAASAVGAGNVCDNMISETTGTCLTVCLTRDKADFDAAEPLQYYVHYDGRYLALAYISTAAAIMKWFKDEFIAGDKDFLASGENVYQYMSHLAKNVKPGCEGLYLLPHFAGKSMPEYAPDLRGAFYGMGLNTTKGHFVRAIQEGIAYTLQENLDTFRRAGVEVNRIRSLGGGSRDLLWNQIKADVTGCELATVEVEETTSLGAAMIAGVAVGIGESVPAVCQKVIREKSLYTPDKASHEIYTAYYRDYLRLDKALRSFAGKD